MQGAAQDPTDFGALQTLMAADRTLMSWVRTSLAMLGFSFSIYQFLENLQSRKVISRSDLPQQIGLLLAAAGSVSILLGVGQYYRNIRDLDRMDRFRFSHPLMIIALILLSSGISLFTGIAFRWF